MGFAGGSDSKESACNVETWVRSLCREDPLEEDIATHSSIRASRVALVVKSPPASAGEVRDAGPTPGWGRSLEKAVEPTPVFLPGESHDRSLGGYSPCGHKKSETTEVT